MDMCSMLIAIHSRWRRSSTPTDSYRFSIFIIGTTLCIHNYLDLSLIFVWASKEKLFHLFTSSKRAHCSTARLHRALELGRMLVCFISVKYMSHLIFFLCEKWPHPILNEWNENQIKRNKIKFVGIIRFRYSTHFNRLSKRKRSKTETESERAQIEEVRLIVWWIKMHCIDGATVTAAIKSKV